MLGLPHPLMEPSSPTPTAPPPPSTGLALWNGKAVSFIGPHPPTTGRASRTHGPFLILSLTLPTYLRSDLFPGTSSITPGQLPPSSLVQTIVMKMQKLLMYLTTPTTFHLLHSFVGELGTGNRRTDLGAHQLQRVTLWLPSVVHWYLHWGPPLLKWIIPTEPPSTHIQAFSTTSSVFQCSSTRLTPPPPMFCGPLEWEHWPCLGLNHFVFCLSPLFTCLNVLNLPTILPCCPHGDPAVPLLHGSLSQALSSIQICSSEYSGIPPSCLWTGHPVPTSLLHAKASSSGTTCPSPLKFPTSNQMEYSTRQSYLPHLPPANQLNHEGGLYEFYDF